MKTISIPVEKNQKIVPTVSNRLIPAMAVSLRNLTVIIGAGIAATGLITFSVWVTVHVSGSYLAAVTWALAFIFLALSVDSRGRAALYQLTTGIAMLVLAFLQSIVTPDFVIVSGVLVASWVAALLFKRLSVHSL